MCVSLLEITEAVFFSKDQFGSLKLLLNKDNFFSILICLLLPFIALETFRSLLSSKYED